MTGKLNKNIGFSLLPFAFIFLFDPGFSMIDLLPDFIGYAIMCLALSNLSDISPRIQEAFLGFRKGILISILRILAIHFLNSYFIESEIAIGTLLFVFVFSFFELFVMIPAYRCLFEGLLSLGIMHEGCAVYYKKIRKIKRLDGQGNEYAEVSESKRNITENAYFFTLAFLFIKAIAVTLPEFTSLTNNSSYEFVTLLRIFGVIIALPIGIIWLVKMLSYFSKVRKDTAFITDLSNSFVKKAKERPNLYTVKSISCGMFILLLSAVLSASIYSDYVDLIPNFAFYIGVIVSAILLRRFSRKWNLLAISAFVGTIVSAIAYSSSVSFHTSFVPSAVKKDINAYYMFYEVLGLQIAESIVMMATIVFILFVLWDIFKSHSDLAVASSEKEKKELKKSFIKFALVVGSISLLSSASSVYYVYAQPFYNMQNWFYYYSAIISIVVNLISVFATCYFIGYVSNSVKYRYRSELY